MISRRHFIKISGLTLSASGLWKSLFGSLGQQDQPPFKNLVSGIKPLAPEDYAYRIEKAKRLMAEKKIDGLFCEGGTNLVYFSNVNWGRSERTFGAVLNLKGNPIWVCPAFELERAKELIPKEHEVRTWEEHESPFRLIGGIMKDLGAGAGRLGVDPSARIFIDYGIQRDAPGLDLVSGDVITDGCRGVKTAKEIAYMDLANKITKLAYREAFKKLREGMSPRELAGLISSYHQQMGAGGGGGPQFGPNTAFPHGSLVPRSLNPGDTIVVDGGCSVEGFRADVTRTIVFGQPYEKQRRVWDVVKEAQTAALQAARPGAACEDVDRAARKVIEEEGFGPDYKYFAHRVGHGIGMEGHEYPYLVRGNKLKLQPGMTFSNEPGIYIYGELGVRTEDCMVITEDGSRFLGGMEAVSIEKPFAGG